MQKFETLRQPLLGFWVRTSEREIMPSTMATTFMPATKGSARTPLGPKSVDLRSFLSWKSGDLRSFLSWKSVDLRSLLSWQSVDLMSLLSWQSVDFRSLLSLKSVDRWLRSLLYWFWLYVASLPLAIVINIMSRGGFRSDRGSDRAWGSLGTNTVDCRFRALEFWLHIIKGWGSNLRRIQWVVAQIFNF